MEAALVASQNPAQPLADLDRARDVVHGASLALETAALDSLDALLQDRLTHSASERSNQLLAGAAIMLAAGLLWLVNRSAGGPRPGAGIEIRLPDRSDLHRRSRLRGRAERSASDSDDEIHTEQKSAAPQPAGLQ